MVVGARTPGEWVSRAVWDLATAAVVVQADQTCGEVDLMLRADGVSHHTSLVVQDVASSRTGLLSRRRFEQTMSGPFGYGRALFAKRPVADLTDWDAAVLSQDASLDIAVEAILCRAERERYDDLLFHGSDQWRRLAAGVVLEEVSAWTAWRAGRDDLTGLANRVTFFEHLQHLGSQQAEDAGIAVIFIDLDRMKAVNDSLGHNVGDALLVSVARRLVAAARPGDVVARLGGDEFAVVSALPAHRENAAATALNQVAHHFLGAIQCADPSLDLRAHSTASIGAAASRGTTTAIGAETLMREADLAMYRAKQAGGDRVVVTVDVGTALDGNSLSVADLSLRQALEQGELEVYYQPILDVRSKRVTSVEALTRWNHPTLGLLGSDWILAAGEAEHQLVALDLWVLRRSVTQLLAWTSALGDRAPTWVNVNISNASVGDARLSSNILAVLAEVGCPPGRLRLELPETASLALAVSASSELTTLVEAGVWLTIDDMGAGASSLRHLSALAISEMKIDRSFVERMLTDVRDRAVIEMLINLAAGLGIRVTAEGVETPDQLHDLSALGVDYVQGYLIGRPDPAAATEERLAAQQLSHADAAS